jgi:hypothetical protein
MLGFLASTQPTKLQKPNYPVILFYIAPVPAAKPLRVFLDILLLLFQIQSVVIPSMEKLYYHLLKEKSRLFFEAYQV